MAVKDAATISFDDKRVKDFFGSIKNRIGEIETRKDSVINDIFSAIIYRDVIEHFQNEQGPKGKWKAKNGKKWSDSYTAFMNRIGKGGNQILQDTGRLRQSFQPGNWRDGGGDTIIWFNNAKTRKGFPYAKAHNEGGPILPQRKFMWLSNKARNSIVDQVLAHVTKD